MKRRKFGFNKLISTYRIPETIIVTFPILNITLRMNSLTIKKHFISRVSSLLSPTKNPETAQVDAPLTVQTITTYNMLKTGFGAFSQAMTKLKGSLMNTSAVFSRRFCKKKVPDSYIGKFFPHLKWTVPKTPKTPKTKLKCYDL